MPGLWKGTQLLTANIRLIPFPGLAGGFTTFGLRRGDWSVALALVTLSMHIGTGALAPGFMAVPKSQQARGLPSGTRLSTSLAEVVRSPSGPTNELRPTGAGVRSHSRMTHGSKCASDSESLLGESDPGWTTSLRRLRSTVSRPRVSLNTCPYVPSCSKQLRRDLDCRIGRAHVQGLTPTRSVWRTLMHS